VKTTISVVAAFALSLVTRFAAAQHVPLPPTVVALDSPEGQRLFEEAEARATSGR
jgi:hypothetical protein